MPTSKEIMEDFLYACCEYNQEKYSDRCNIDYFIKDNGSYIQVFVKNEKTGDKLSAIFETLESLEQSKVDRLFYALARKEGVVNA